MEKEVELIVDVTFSVILLGYLTTGEINTHRTAIILLKVETNNIQHQRGHILTAQVSVES